MSKNTFKVVIVGDGGCGKTVFVKRHETGHFNKNYIATMGVDVTPLPFSVVLQDGAKQTAKIVTLNIWDCAGQEKFYAMAESYYEGADGVIIMFDLTSRISYKNVSAWYRKIRAVLPNVPVVLCGNKVDCFNRAVRAQDIRFHQKHHVTYFDISAKSNYNFEKPFLHLIRQFLHRNDIFFGEMEDVSSEYICLCCDPILRCWI